MTRIALLLAAAVLLAGCQSANDVASRLDAALERMEQSTARLEMSATSEMSGSTAFGGSFTETIHAVGELVPPDRVHLFVDGAGAVRELVIVGRKMWVDAGDGLRLMSRVPVGPLAEAQAPLQFIRGPGHLTFAGVGVVRGAPTYRIRIDLNAAELQERLRSDQPVDPDSRGSVEVEVGMFDGLIRRQTLEVVEPADPFSGTGLAAVRTRYTVEYWDHGRQLVVREPD